MTTTNATWIAHPLAVWTGNGDDAGNGVVVRGNRILELVPAGREPASTWQTKVDAREQVLLPGLINCHHHYYQTLTRAFPGAQNRGLFEWLRALYPVWAGLDEESIAVATRLALAELLLSGCTTSVDHHYLFSAATTSAIDIQAQVVREMAVRAVLTRGSMSLGESAGGLPPDRVVQTEDAILADSERLIRTHHDGSDGAMLRIALAPCSPFSVTPELMRETAALARRHDVLLHTHLAETEDEDEFCRERFGMRPLDYLASVDWLDRDVWLAHGIHFNDDEISRLGAHGVAVCHCPTSNMILASGCCPVAALEQAGVAVGLGVDGSASNDHSNLMAEVRQAFLLQRLQYGADRIRVDHALHWATGGGARLLQRPELGEIRPGALADLALFQLDDLRFSGIGDPVTALITSGARRARHVMVNGEWRVRDYTIDGLDSDALIHRHRTMAKRLAASV